MTQRLPVEFTTSAADARQFPRDGLPEVAFLGRSNVGKSSLLNALAGTRNLARVSSTPGRTQLVNFFRAGHELYLVDLPGYGFAKVPEAVRRSWERLITSYLETRAPLALGVVLVDLRHEPQENDLLLQQYLEHHGIRHVVAATKADKLGRGERAQRTKALRGTVGRSAVDVIAVSAVDRTGIDELWHLVREAARENREERHAAKQ